MNASQAVQRRAEVVRRKHLALAKGSNYCAWFRRYCGFAEGLPLPLPSEHKLERFLTVLAHNDVWAGTQNQAFIKFREWLSAMFCRASGPAGRAGRPFHPCGMSNPGWDAALRRPEAASPSISEKRLANNGWLVTPPADTLVSH
ncbi:MAG: hypothetical protein ABSG78_19265 [Verrucomicrobiota bacterium]|jgi:hypothetical protein